MIEGKKILQIRPMTKREQESEGWEGSYTIPVAIDIEGGWTLYAGSDEEANSPGALFLRKRQPEECFLLSWNPNNKEK